MGVQIIPIGLARNAVRGGMAAAHGKYMIIGDCDGSYDFSESLLLLEKLREGYFHCGLRGFDRRTAKKPENAGNNRCKKCKEGYICKEKGEV